MYYLKLAQGGRSSYWYSTRQSLMLYQATRPHSECHKSYKGHLTNFKWYIVACAGRSGECCHFCIIWMTSFGGFSSNPWILLTKLGLKSLAHLPSALLEASEPHEVVTICRWKRLDITKKAVTYNEDFPHTYRNHHSDLALWLAKKTFNVLPKVLFC